MRISWYFSFMMARCRNDYEIAEFIVEKYKTHPERILSTFRRENVITCHKYYLDTKMKLMLV